MKSPKCEESRKKLEQQKEAPQDERDSIRECNTMSCLELSKIAFVIFSAQLLLIEFEMEKTIFTILEEV